MKTILAIDTSCDETAAAITQERRIISSAIYSQVLIHQKWGGVVPSLAKRAHEERIDGIVALALKKAHMGWDDIDAVAVTQGPGLAIALGVGITYAKQYASMHNLPLIGVNHLAGHLYSAFAQNSKGNPVAPLFAFPYLGMIISGGHTEFVLWKDHLQYEILGSTVDDAAGEALDKAGKLLGLGYPAGSVLERLAAEVNNRDEYHFPRPMLRSNDLQFSFSGLKTAFYYHLKQMDTKDIPLHLRELASSFQAAVFDTILAKTEKAIKQTGISRLVIGGGVTANMHLRAQMRALVRKHKGTVLFPSYRYLTGDNAAMIGITAYWDLLHGRFRKPEDLERIPRLTLGGIIWS